MAMYAANFMAGQVALVTGGTGGIGGAVCEALALAGARVVSADLAIADRAQADVGIERIALDVSSAAQVRACVEGVLARLGRLDLLVTVAGVVSVGNAQDLPEAEWDRVVDINLKGTFLCCQAVIPAMKKQNFGRIVNIGSVLGKNGGNPRPWINPREQERSGNVAYGVSKAGVHIMTSFLARELAASGITVNAVAPGPVASAMTTQFPDALRALIPVGRMGQAAEVASAVLFLASPDSGFVTGEILDVNGGLWSD